MNATTIANFQQWAADWQAGEPTRVTPKQIRHYVAAAQRPGLVVDGRPNSSIGGIALPILVYLGWTADATSSGWA